MHPLCNMNVTLTMVYIHSSAYIKRRGNINVVCPLFVHDKDPSISTCPWSFWNSPFSMLVFPLLCHEVVNRPLTRNGSMFTPLSLTYWYPLWGTAPFPMDGDKRTFKSGVWDQTHWWWQAKCPLHCGYIRKDNAQERYLTRYVLHLWTRISKWFRTVLPGRD